MKLAWLAVLVSACATTPYTRKLPTTTYVAPPETLYDTIYRELIPLHGGRPFLNPEDKRLLWCAFYEDHGGKPLTPGRAKWPPDVFYCVQMQLVAAGAGWRVELHGQGKKVEAHRRDVPELEQMLSIEAPPRELAHGKELIDSFDEHLAEVLAKYAAK